MAISVSNWVWDHSRSRNGARLVALALADCAREDGSAWPSVTEICRKTGLTPRAVQAGIGDLVKLRELEVGYQLGPKGCNRYRLLMPPTPADYAGVQKMRGARSAPPQKLRGGRFASPQVSTDTPADSAPPAESAPPQIFPPTPAESAGGTVKEPSLKSSTKTSHMGGAGGATLFGDGPGVPPAKTVRISKRQAPEHPRFAEWYAAYPSHKERAAASDAYARAVAAGADPDVLMTAAAAYKQDPIVLRGYIKNPATWLNKQCWLDEPTRPAAQNGSGPAVAKKVNYADEEYASGW